MFLTVNFIFGVKILNSQKYINESNFVVKEVGFMKITNIKYDIVTEEKDYTAESRAQKMIEMANELRAQRDKAQQVYGSATQEIGWKKVQVFLENIETQIKPLLYALKSIKEASNDLHGRFCVTAYTSSQPFSRWEIYADSDGKIEIQARLRQKDYCENFPFNWVKENGEPRGVISAEAFYGENGIVANTDFSEVLKEIDHKIEYEYNAQLDKMRDKQAYYENSFKKMANIDECVSLDAVIKNVEKRVAESAEKGTHNEKDIVKD